MLNNFAQLNKKVSEGLRELHHGPKNENKDLIRILIKPVIFLGINIVTEDSIKLTKFICRSGFITHDARKRMWFSLKQLMKSSNNEKATRFIE